MRRITQTSSYSMRSNTCGSKTRLRISGTKSICLNRSTAKPSSLKKEVAASQSMKALPRCCVPSLQLPVSKCKMMFFLSHGYRVVAHDRRGHGRSTQTADGHDMDHYADDLAAVTAHLDLKNAIHVGHSTGGGEVVHYIARHGTSRVAKAVLISAVPPLMVKTPGNPGGLPKEVFDGFQKQVAMNRAQFYYD